MKIRLVIVLVLIVVTPLVVVGWLGARAVRDEQVVVEHRFRELVEAQLREVEDDLLVALDRYAQAVLAEASAAGAGPAALRRLSLESPFVLQHYRIDGQGRLLFPPVYERERLPEAELESLARTRQVWEGGALLAATTNGGERAADAAPDFGWHTWYWGEGLQWLLWFRDGDTLRVAEVHRARLLAWMIEALPETDARQPELAEGRIDLVDAAGEALYRWGALDVADAATPLATHTLAVPLGGWKLEYRAPGRPFGGALAGFLNLVVGLTALTVVVGGLVLYVYREQTRSLREAAQRVTFVNQVSHELKTPLTNIRMYAELLEAGLDESDPHSRQQLGVIVSESTRLSRLIGNVLTFGRGRRGALKLQVRPGVVDDVVRNVLESFGPSLAAERLELAFRPAAAEPASLDPDAIEQIVGNLVGNVEKYAAAGRHLAVVTARSGDDVTITVTDRGPGVSPGERERIFEPFHRVGSALTEGKSGAGIGLTIARELARLHGGDLVFVPSTTGATFRVTLRCPLLVSS